MHETEVWKTKKSPERTDDGFPTSKIPICQVRINLVTVQNFVLIILHSCHFCIYLNFKQSSWMTFTHIRILKTLEKVFIIAPIDLSC